MTESIDARNPSVNLPFSGGDTDRERDSKYKYSPLKSSPDPYEVLVFMLSRYCVKLTNSSAARSEPWPVTLLPLVTREVMRQNARDTHGLA